MSVGSTHRLYLIGTSQADAVQNSEPYLYEKSAQEDADEGSNVYYIDVTLFASRLKQVERWGEEKPVPASVTLPETTRVDLGVLYPYKPGESASDWTTRVLSHASDHGTNRQCSIGWHGECSDSGLGEAAECNCICHGELVETYTVEGHAEGGEVTVLRAERGKHMWMEQEGEPATMWAWWVYARSETEAAVQGATKERNRLG